MKNFCGLGLFSKYTINASHLWHHRKKWHLRCSLHDAYSSLNECHIKLSSYLNKSLIKLNVPFTAYSVIKLFRCHFFFSWKFILVNHKPVITDFQVVYHMFLHFLFIWHWVDEFLKILKIKYIIKVEIERKYSEIKQQLCKWNCFKNKCLIKINLQNTIRNYQNTPKYTTLRSLTVYSWT